MASSSSLHLAWLDSNIYSSENKELLKKIRELSREAMEFNEEEECLRFLGRGIADPRRFIFIVSGTLGQRLVPELHQHENIICIYVYCGNRQVHETWSRDYRKVTVITSPEEVLKRIKLDQERF